MLYLKRQITPLPFLGCWINSLFLVDWRLSHWNLRHVKCRRLAYSVPIEFWNNKKLNKLVDPLKLGCRDWYNDFFEKFWCRRKCRFYFWIGLSLPFLSKNSRTKTLLKSYYKYTKVFKNIYLMVFQLDIIMKRGNF